MPTALTSNGYIIDQGAGAFGWFLDSTEHVGNASVLRSRLLDHGYLFLRDILETELLLRVRELVAGELSRLDLLDPDIDPSVADLPARADVDFYDSALGIGGDELRQITRQAALLEVFSAVFGEEPRAFDYIWRRVAGPGRCELPHCDWVYMCRGTNRLLTAWIPLMDVPVRLGPLMILENSHLDNPHTRAYLNMDVDKLGFLYGLRLKHGRLIYGGRYSRQPNKVRDQFGARWLTEDFNIGDVIIFDTRCMHATLDNQTAGFRSSVDVRFQPASEPADPRFVGPNPIVHANRQKSVFDYYRSLKSTLSRLID